MLLWFGQQYSYLPILWKGFTLTIFLSDNCFYIQVSVHLVEYK